MAGDILRHVHSGEEVITSAARENAWTDAARAIKRMPAGRSPTLSPGFDYGKVLVKNESGETVPRFGIIGLEESRITGLSKTRILEQFKQAIVFKGRKPDFPDDVSRFAVMLQRTANNKWGEALIAGMTQCQVNYTTAAETEDRKFADITGDNVDYLTATGGGKAQVLWREGGSGEQWALILLGPPVNPILLGKTTTAHGKGDTESVTIYEATSFSTPKGSEAATSYSVSAYNRWADLDSGKWVRVQWQLNGWELINGEC